MKHRFRISKFNPSSAGGHVWPSHVSGMTESAFAPNFKISSTFSWGRATLSHKSRSKLRFYKILTREKQWSFDPSALRCVCVDKKLVTNVLRSVALEGICVMIFFQALNRVFRMMGNRVIIYCSNFFYQWFIWFEYINILQ